MKRILIVGTDLQDAQKVMARLPYDKMRSSMMYFNDAQEMTAFLRVLGNDSNRSIRPLDGLIIVSDLTTTDDLLLLSSSHVWRNGSKPLTLLVGEATAFKQTLLERLIGHIDFVARVDGNHAAFTSFVLTATQDVLEQEAVQVMVG